MGGTLSCGRKGHTPAGEDKLPYGPPVKKPIGIVQPQERSTILESSGDNDITKPVFTNNNNNALKSPEDKHDTSVTSGRSWKFWKSLSFRSPKSSKPTTYGINTSIQFSDTHNSDGPDKSDLTRSLSLKPPPKPPRSFVARANSVRVDQPTGQVNNDGIPPVSVTQTNIPSAIMPKDTGTADKSSPPVNTTVNDYENVDSAAINVYLAENDSVPLPITQKCVSLPNYTLGSVTRRQHSKSSGKIRIVSPDLTRKTPPKPRKKSTEITAEDRHVLILQSAAELICQKVDPFVVLERLTSAGLLDQSELNVFRNPYDSRQFCEIIVQSVMNRDYSSFLAFCDILRSVTDYTAVAAILDAMVAVYDVIYEVQITSGDMSPILDDEKTVSFDVVYYNLENGKVRSVIELEKLRNTENKRHSRDLLSFKRNSRLSFQSFQSLNSEVSSVFSEDIITNGLPMVTVSVAGHVLSMEKARTLAAVLENHNCILEVHLGKTHLRGTDMEHIGRALTQNTCVRVLDLRLNNIGNSGAAQVAHVLYQNRFIKQLNLSSTGIDSEGCKLIADSLRTNSSLEDLDMSFLDIGDNGCMALSGMLKQNRCLKKLRLRSDSISWIGCGFLLEGIEQGKTVSELDLSRNFIGDTGAEMFLRHMKDDSSLREVNLENCSITAAGCSVLSDVILTNKSVRSLDLSANFIGDQGILKLSNALDRNRHIRTLGLNMCGISNDGFSKLLDILEGNTTLALLKLCYNRLGKEHVNPEATSENLKYRIRIVTSSNPKLKLLLWGNTFDDSNSLMQFKDLNASI